MNYNYYQIPQTAAAAVTSQQSTDAASAEANVDEAAELTSPFSAVTLFFSEAADRVKNPNPSSKLRMWEYLLVLYRNPQWQVVTVLSHSKHICKISDIDRFERLWNTYKGDRVTLYEGMARSLRKYYKKGLIRHIKGVNMLYQLSVQLAHRDMDERKEEVIKLFQIFQSIYGRPTNVNSRQLPLPSAT